MQMKKRVFIIIIIIVLLIPIKLYAKGIDGTTIVLNPGHGGVDTGCANNQLGLVEMELTLKIAKYLRDYLNNYYNVKVILTHEGGDAGNISLVDRAMIARNNNADLYASLHIDDMSNKNTRGATVYITSRTELYKYKEGMTVLGNKILNNLGKLGIPSRGVQNRYCQDTTPKYQYYDGSQADYYADIRFAMKGNTDWYGPNFSDGSGISTVLIEHCYMNNLYDVQHIDSDADLKMLAEADGNAIVEYYALRLKSDVVANITIENADINIVKGEKVNVNAEVKPNTATNKKLEWSSENSTIATVDQEGNITAIDEGKTKIKIKSKDNPNVIKYINVNVEDYKVKFENEEENILTNKTKKLSLNVGPTWIENKNIIWESSNEEILEVDQDGTIIGKNQGVAQVTAIWEEKGLSDTITINVYELPENTQFNISEYSVNDYKISNIGPKVKIEEFLDNITYSENLEIEIKTASENQEYIGTNTKMIVKEKNLNIILEEYECLIYADINGDGKITSLDYTLIKNDIMEVKKIENNNMRIVADVYNDGKITSLDYTLIKNDIMDIKKIDKK